MDDKVHEIMFPEKDTTNDKTEMNPNSMSPRPTTSSDEESSSGDKKRPKCSAITMPAFGISPPNFVSFEEIMKTAQDIEKMALVNEIVLNDDFKLQKTEEPKNPLEKAIKENMKKAFWDILAEQLRETPPNYQQVVSLLSQMKDILLLFLLPQHTQLKADIDEVLDFELIQQQLDNDAFEWQRYAQYIVSVCSRLCSPSCDDMIRTLTQEKELIPMFQGIFELLDRMRLDISNFFINQFRSQIQKSSAEYEREKFKELIETHQKCNLDALEHTTGWLKRSYESLDLSQENNLKNICYKITIAAYMDLLKCITPAFDCYKIEDSQATVVNDKNNAVPSTSGQTTTSPSSSSSSSSSSKPAPEPSSDYPETVLLIRHRVELLREAVFKLTIISSVFVVTFAVVGEPLQSVKEFRQELKTKLDAIISPPEGKHLQFMKVDDLKAILDSAAQQVVKSISESIVKYQTGPGAKPIDDKKLESLQYQICELAGQNRIRAVMERRILEFIERVISSSTADPVQIPAGLSTFAADITKIAGNFARLVSYNRSVYSSFYTQIISKITAEKHYISPSELQVIEKSFSG